MLKRHAFKISLLGILLMGAAVWATFFTSSGWVIWPTLGAGIFCVFAGLGLQDNSPFGSDEPS